MKTIIENHYKEHYPALIKRVRYKLRSQEAAEEVVMEAFTSALQYQDSFDSNLSPFEVWFNTILDNCMKKHSRVESLHGMTRSSEDDLDEVFEERISDGEMHSLLIEEMNKNVFATILRLHFVDGHTFSEVSDMTSVSLSAVSYEVRKFKKKMLKKYGH